MTKKVVLDYFWMVTSIMSLTKDQIKTITGNLVGTTCLIPRPCISIYNTNAHRCQTNFTPYPLLTTVR